MDSHWQELLSELWAGIFSLSRPDSLPLCLLIDGETWFYQLQAVCRAFKTVFHRYPQLYCILRPRQLSVASSNQLAALTHWCHQHSQHVKSMVCMHEGPVAETALAGLQSENAALTRLMLHQFPQQAVSFLGNFACLVECFLVNCNPSGTECCLSPLQGLPELTKLVLTHGSFTDVDVASKLTSLHMTRTTVKCTHDCISVETLVNLIMCDSCLIGFHQGGILACSHLQVLVLHNSKGYDGVLDVMIDLTQTLPGDPARLSAMTALTRLQFTFTNQHQEVFVWRLDWLTDLVNLQSVKAVVHHLDAFLPASISSLTSLTIIEIKADRIGLSFDWTALKSLQCLRLSANEIVCNPEAPFKLTGLLELHHLEEVAISQSGVWSHRLRSHLSPLGQFVSRIRVARPDITFLLQETA